MESTQNNEFTFKVDDVTPRGNLWDQILAKDCFKCDFSSYEPNQKIVEFGPVAFLEGLYEAFGLHFPIKLSPDDFWLLILQGFSNHVNANAEKLRNLFVNFEGKKTLIAINNKFTKDQLKRDDYEDAVSQLVGQIPNYINKDLIDAMKPDFSTTSKSIYYTGCLSVMCSFKKYFEYRMHCCGCGFPSITLTGTVQDWEKIGEKITILEKYDLGWWVKEIKPVIEKIIETRKGNIDLDFWKSMMQKTNERAWSVGASGIRRERNFDFLSGWILKFFPYDKKGNCGIEEKIKVSEIRNFAPQLLQVPFILQDFYGKEYNMIFNSGFLGMNQDKDTFTVSSSIGWYVSEGKLENDPRRKGMFDF